MIVIFQHFVLFKYSFCLTRKKRKEKKSQVTSETNRFCVYIGRNGRGWLLNLSHVDISAKKKSVLWISIVDFEHITLM